MADKKGLETVGVAFGLVTAIVIMIGGIVVTGHINGRFAVDAGTGIDMIRPVASAAAGSILR
jgi:hypothetical protein